MDAEIAEASAAHNAESLRRVALRSKFGLASANDVRSAEQTLAQSLNNLESLRISIENERNSLRKILRLPLEDERIIDVEYEFELSGLPEDTEEYVADRLLNEPTMRQKQFNVDIKKAEHDDYMKQNRDFKKEDEVIKQTDVLKRELDKAVREQNDARVSLEAAMRSNLSRIEQSEKRSEALLVDLQKAEDLRDVLTARFKAGFVTKFDADGAALSVLQNEISIQKNINNIYLLGFMQANPFLLN